MEDSFRVRVDKVFGTLGGDTASSVGVTPSLWCLTDEEIERREWNRSKEVPEEEDDRVESRPSVVQADLESDLKELSDCEEEADEEGEEIDAAKKRRRNNSGGAGDSTVDEYLDVRSNIGRDCTLDFEEEEDEFDKVAVGTEQTGVKYVDYEVDEISGYDELPRSFQDAAKDPRANHSAAKIRLREDAEAAGDFDALQLSDSSMATNLDATNLDAEDIQKGEVDVDNPKPILKKRENSMDTKSQKRVRFMVDPKSSTHEDQQTSGASDLTSETNATDDNSVPKQASDLSVYTAGVPDYVKNPSKYTHYTFNSSDDMDEESNRKAHMDFFHELRKRNTDTLMEETPVDMPKSIVFTPKKKHENDTAAKSDSELKTRENPENKKWSVDITAEDNQESEISAMEEDEPGLSVRKPGRQYRTKTNVDIDE
ncbi:hypothetical protein C2S53_014541 [Perilla frutescens var. hirtella]|uniref:U5 small nuclear ribonucleoprotein TSSC4 n=1 Tax=Perilla frutescens var. hirtella TaxID=608512 RepID=A0AAD4P941_PERFH|nr:hypothetical protein C2S53_014541 [Perilla frutescens var. hirtella]